MRLILASGSPRRAELIKKVAAEFDGLAIEIMPSDVPESISQGETPESYAMRVATDKARKVYSRIHADQNGGGLPVVVLGCDTVVTFGGKIYGKPMDKADAERMFGALCGNTHEVITGVCMITHGFGLPDLMQPIAAFEKTYVTFGAFCPQIVYTYIESGRSFDKAGGYGLQDSELAPLITNVEGDSDNVIGLPVKKVVRMLREYGTWH